MLANIYVFRLIWLARPPFRTLYDTQTDRMQMISLRIDRNCMVSHLHAISCGETIRSEIILLTRGMHTPNPPRCWPLKFTIPSYKSWIRSWYNCYANIPMLFIVQFPSRRYMSNLFNNSSCFQTFNWWKDSKWKKKQKKVQLMEWLGWKTRSTSSAEDPTECTSSRIRNHSMNWKKKKLK